MHKKLFWLSRAGAACLLVGALAGFASVLIEPTISDKAADQAAAISAHAGAVHAGIAVNAVGAVLLVGGLIWLAGVASKSAMALAVSGGVVAVLGLLAVMLDNGIQLAGSVVAEGLGTNQATTLLQPLDSGGVATAGVISVLNDIGMILLGVALLKTSVPKWAGAVVIVGAVVQAAGFGSGKHYVAAVGFALLFFGFAATVRAIFASGSEQAASPANAAALTAPGESSPA